MTKFLPLGIFFEETIGNGKIKFIDETLLTKKDFAIVRSLFSQCSLEA